MKTVASKLAGNIISSLDGRNGFDHWWADIDDDIRQEIIDELAKMILFFVTEYIKKIIYPRMEDTRAKQIGNDRDVDNASLDYLVREVDNKKHWLSGYGAALLDMDKSLIEGD